MKSELDNLARSYARLSHDVGGRINFACDLNNDDALKVAEQEKDHLDQAFFILSFAALEKQITSLACARLADADRQAAMRDADFQKRWRTSIQVAEETLGIDVEWSTTERTISSWYRIRNLIAHGQSPTQLADVPTILFQADKVAETLEQVTQQLND